MFSPTIKLLIVAFPAVELFRNCVKVPAPALLIVAFPAVDVSSKIVCPKIPTPPVKLLIVAFPAVEFP